MKEGKKMQHCRVCANPNLAAYKNAFGHELQFYKDKNGIICSDCKDFFDKHSYFDRAHFNTELEEFLSNNSRILFAYSGGLDSTAVLFMLSNICRMQNIELEVFTVDTGFKGTKTVDNINQVINFLGLTGNHFWVDYKDSLNYSPAVINLMGKPETTMNVYKSCWQRGLLPCGKICNSIMEAAYFKLMETKGYNTLFTGGDTPKINSSGKYSIFWQDGKILTVRGGYAFGLSKRMNDQLIRNNNIPWVNPKCGGYDTDCLFPGAMFAKQLKGTQKIEVEELYRSHPIIFYYLSERTRFDIINREDSIEMMNKVDISDLSSYIELIETVL